MDRIIEKKKWPPRRIAAFVVLFLVLSLVVYLIFFRDRSSRIYVDRQSINIVEVQQGEFQEFIPVDGIVQPLITIYVDAVFGGRVEEIFVRDGALVDKDQPIVRLSNATIEKEYMFQENQALEVLNNYQNTRLNLERNKFTLEREMADLEYQRDLANTSFKRKKELYDQGHISDEEFENSQREFNLAHRRYDIALRALEHDSIYTRTQMVQIKESIDRMQVNLQVLSDNLENLTVRAPVQGQLSSFKAEIGETWQAGENLGQIDVPDGFKLRARIDERYINRTFTGQKASFDYGGQKYDLEIGKIYSNVTSGAFEVDMYFVGNVPEGIKRGQTIQLRLEFSGLTDALIIPRGGFYQQTGGNWIYVVDSSGEYAMRRPIKIGRQNIRFYEVLEGLAPGEKVIVSSYDIFANKDRVIFR